MSAISDNSYLSSLSINGTADQQQQKKTGSAKDLGQDAFLKLMITQMNNQSPLDPQDNTAFISQLAQFSSVEGLDKLNKNFDQFANNFVSNQALQASSLVGRSVSVQTDTTQLNPQGIVNINANLPESTGDAKVNIYNDSGQLVDQIDMGTQPAGDLNLRWDGMNAELNGKILDWQSSQEGGAAPGSYRFEVIGSVDGKDSALNTYLSANVNSVTVGSDGGLVLNLAGIGAVSLADVKQFNE